MRLLANPYRDRSSPLSVREEEYLGASAPSCVRELLEACPAYAATPLWRLPKLAQRLGVENIWYKDESFRLGLNSFKALGGVYAVIELVFRAARENLGKSLAPSQLLSDEVRAVSEAMTFTTASDGNHGRAVAAGAKLVGARCVVYLHEGVSAVREKWITRLGASVIRTRGTYDHSVEISEREANRCGWTYVPDTSSKAEDEIPALIMRGYTVLADEALSQLSAAGGTPITHLFVQAGVGGLAASMAAHLHARLGEGAPVTCVVEPETADCLLQSCVSGEATEVEHTESTIYSMLECNKPSSLAWALLKRYGDFFISVADEYAELAMRRLAFSEGRDPTIVAGESGSAGFAGLLRVLENQDWARMVGLTQSSSVLLIGTEGATDPGVYQTLVGKTVEDVRRKVAPNKT